MFEGFFDTHLLFGRDILSLLLHRLDNEED